MKSVLVPLRTILSVDFVLDCSVYELINKQLEYKSDVSIYDSISFSFVYRL